MVGNNISINHKWSRGSPRIYLFKVEVRNIDSCLHKEGRNHHLQCSVFPGPSRGQDVSKESENGVETEFGQGGFI